jgi:hypothetical protein
MLEELGTASKRPGDNTLSVIANLSPAMKVGGLLIDRASKGG